MNRKALVMTELELGPVMGLAMPSWVEDWNNRSREHVPGHFGFTTMSVSYYARLDDVEAHATTTRRPKWFILRKSDTRLKGLDTPLPPDDEVRYILMPEAVRTTVPASTASQRDMKRELAQHVRHVLVNHYGTADDVALRQLSRVSEQLTPRSVIINGEVRAGWGVDELPHVVALCAALEQGAFLTAVLDKGIASALNVQFVELPQS